jgi:3-deoxy-manno-octulosonate cytidylyltransferase (CMP-KDO synthetase)
VGNGMRIIGVVPARGGSTRFYNKPLATILGKPMVWWVYTHSKEVECFDEVYVATDSEEIKAVCEGFGAKVIMTRKDHDTATDRLYEVSQRIDAELYVMINGDEPAVESKDIVKCIPVNLTKDEFYVSNLMTNFSDPVEVVDTSNLKIVTNKDGICLFISRSPIPFPKGGMNYAYQKFVGVGAFTKKALQYYHETPRGPIEKIEENDSFRFIENRKDIYYINAHCKTISVDTPKDIGKVEEYLLLNGKGMENRSTELDIALTK